MDSSTLLCFKTINISPRCMFSWFQWYTMCCVWHFRGAREGEKREERRRRVSENVLSFRLELDQVVPWACDEPCSVYYSSSVYYYDIHHTKLERVRACFLDIRKNTAKLVRCSCSEATAEYMHIVEWFSRRKNPDLVVYHKHNFGLQ